MNELGTFGFFLTFIAVPIIWIAVLFCMLASPQDAWPLNYHQTWALVWLSVILGGLGLLAMKADK